MVVFQKTLGKDHKPSEVSSLYMRPKPWIYFTVKAKMINFTVKAKMIIRPPLSLSLDNQNTDVEEN